MSINAIKQLMHSFEVSIRILSTRKLSDVHRGKGEVDITFEG